MNRQANGMKFTFCFFTFLLTLAVMSSKIDWNWILHLCSLNYADSISIQKLQNQNFLLFSLSFACSRARSPFAVRITSMNDTFFPSLRIHFTVRLISDSFSCPSLVIPRMSSWRRRKSLAKKIHSKQRTKGEKFNSGWERAWSLKNS